LKKKYNIVGLVLKSNGKIIETGKINTPITLYMYMLLFTYLADVAE
jgi:hypothetical protein